MRLSGCHGLGIDASVTVDPSDLSPPSTYHFPTAAQYTKAVAGATNYAIDWGTNEVRAAFSLPAQSSLTSLKTLIESTAGTSLAQLIAGQMPSGTPPMVSSMMTHLLDNAIDVVVSGVSSAAESAISGIVGVVPVLGQVAGAVIGIIQTVANAAKGVSIDPRADEAASQQAWNQFSYCIDTLCRAQQDKCTNVRATFYDVASGQSQRSIADVFRPFAYAMHRAQSAANGGVAIPWCGMMPFVALCGGETEGVLWKTRSEYNVVVQQLRAKHGDSKLGVPIEAQRRMWTYFKSVLSCVNDPVVSHVQQPTGDAGRSMMPMLIDLAWSFCKENSRRSATLKSQLPGYWTIPFLRDLVNYHAPWCQGSGTVDGAAHLVSGRCGDRGIDIVGDFDLQTGFGKLFSDYDVKLDYLFGNGKFVMNPAMRAVLSASGKKAVVVVSKQQADGLMAQLGALEHLSAPKAAALVTGLVAAGYLGYEGYRLVAHKRRR